LGLFYFIGFREGYYRVVMATGLCLSGLCLRQLRSISTLMLSFVDEGGYLFKGKACVFAKFFYGDVLVGFFIEF